MRPAAMAARADDGAGAAFNVSSPVLAASFPLCCRLELWSQLYAAARRPPAAGWRSCPSLSVGDRSSLLGACREPARSDRPADTCCSASLFSSSSGTGGLPARKLVPCSVWLRVKGDTLASWLPSVTGTEVTLRRRSAWEALGDCSWPTGRTLQRARRDSSTACSGSSLGCPLIVRLQGNKTGRLNIRSSHLALMLSRPAAASASSASTAARRRSSLSLRACMVQARASSGLSPSPSPSPTAAATTKGSTGADTSLRSGRLGMGLSGWAIPEEASEEAQLTSWALKVGL